MAADDVPVASRRDYWMHTLDEAIGPLDLRTEGLDSGDWAAVWRARRGPHCRAVW
jgi:hypothetical protein